VLDVRKGAEVGIVSMGSNDPAIQEARDLLRAQRMETSYMRLRGLADQPGRARLPARLRRVFVVENNHSGQLQQILLSEEPICGGDLVSIARNNGLPLSAEWIAGEIERLF